MQLEKRPAAGAEPGATSTLHRQERENHSEESGVNSDKREQNNRVGCP